MDFILCRRENCKPYEKKRMFDHQQKQQPKQKLDPSFPILYCSSRFYFVFVCLRLCHYLASHSAHNFSMRGAFFSLLLSKRDLGFDMNHDNEPPTRNQLVGRMHSLILLSFQIEVLVIYASFDFCF